MKKTVIILGAGASADYGYPLWSQLKQQICEMNPAEIPKKIEFSNSGAEQAHKDAFIEFKDQLNQSPEATLDQIIYRMDKPKSKHLQPTGRYMINFFGYLLARVESQQKKKGWVTDFQEMLVDYLATRSGDLSLSPNKLENLTVVSLNYDRVFEHNISSGFYEKLIQHPSYEPKDLSFSINFSRQNRLSVLKPHGSLANLKNDDSRHLGGMNHDLLIDLKASLGLRGTGSNFSIPYGSQTVIDPKVVESMGQKIFVLDEQTEQDYSLANRALNEAQQVICLGLSPAGIIQSKLVFNDNQNVYLSNKGQELVEIRQHKTAAKFVPLGTDTVRLDSRDFPQQLRKLILEDPVAGCNSSI